MKIVVAAAVVMIILVMHRMNKKKKENPPGPSGVPLLGNLLQFDKSKPLTYLHHLSHKYGPLVYLKHGSTPILVVSSAKLAKQILKSHDTRPRVLAQQKLSYNGADMAFSPYNPHWKEMRRMCVLHLFSPNQLLSFRPIREGQVARMIANISTLARHADPVPANLSDMAMSLASNIICGVAFGRTYDDHEYEKKRLDKLVLEAQALMVGFYFSDHFPAVPVLFSWVVDKLSGLLGRLDDNFRELDAFYEQLIDQHLHPPTYASAPPPDILDLMIQLKRQKPDSVTWDHIKAMLMNLFVAGTDTVAAAVVWTMTGLMLRPTMMKKTQEHIRQAMGCKKGMIEEDELGKLPYLKAVVMEALRLYPPAPLLYRTQEEQQTIGGYEIEAGAKFIINGWTIGRDPERWEDPDEFVPERFMSGGSGLEWESELRMLPFGGGRRGCPGMGMGLLAIHLALANLLYSFDWALPPSAPTIDTDALPGLTMHKKNPLLLLPILPSSSTTTI